MRIPITPLGQCGFRFQLGTTIVYTDPYLTNHVAEVEGQEMQRLRPAPVEPGSVSDADFILVTHAHLDHCDLKTLVPLSVASSACRFVCPNEVSKLLISAGIDSSRVILAREDWIMLGREARVIPVPAAHPRIEYDNEGFLRCVGYVMEFRGRKFYHGGDGSPDDLVLDRLSRVGPIDVAFIPVNEQNFYREKRGIVGNMSVREAFQMAADLGVKTLVPTHWDMFAPNSVFKEELNLLYTLIRPPFEMKLDPQEL